MIAVKCINEKKNQKNSPDHSLSMWAMVVSTHLKVPCRPVFEPATTKERIILGLLVVSRQHHQESIQKDLSTKLLFLVF